MGPVRDFLDLRLSIFDENFRVFPESRPYFLVGGGMGWGTLRCSMICRRAHC